jgi:uncharacterized protein (DUF1501 family)
MTTQLSRRRFLQHTGALSGISAIGAPFLLNLSAMADAAAATPASDYKALVCLFFNGGNDAFNMVLPLDATSMATYSAVRPEFAHSSASILRVTPTKVNGQANTADYGLAPNMTNAQTLFNSGKLAIVANVGPLVRNITKTEFYTGVDVPQAIQSHNDQQSTWQSGGTEGTISGWGGAVEQTVQAAAPGIESAFRSVSLSGSAVFGATDALAPYNMAPFGSGGVEINTWRAGGTTATYSTLAKTRRSGSTNLLELDLANMVSRSIEAVAYLKVNIDQTMQDGYPAIPGNDTNSQLCDRLRQVSRMIALRSKQPGRQIFFVSIGGFDTHDHQAVPHAALMAAIDNGLNYFQSRMEALGQSNNVTLFTASDFGRQLAHNSNEGTDHGWGAHHFVLGGAVNGKQIYGRIPSYARDTGGAYTDANMIQSYGMMLPQFSVDQYAATLGAWFGIAPGMLVNIIPSLSKYSVQNLGFLNACVASGSGATACLA